jgi:hypothetical protein
MTIRQTLAQWFYSPGAYGLWLALDDVENWRVEDSIAYYRPKVSNRHGLEFVDKCTAAIYIGGGGFYFDGHMINNTPKFLGLLERHFLWRRFRQMSARRKQRDRVESNREMLFRFTRLEEPK